VSSWPESAVVGSRWLTAADTCEGLHKYIVACRERFCSHWIVSVKSECLSNPSPSTFGGSHIALCPARAVASVVSIVTLALLSSNAWSAEVANVEAFISETLGIAEELFLDRFALITTSASAEVLRANLVATHVDLIAEALGAKVDTALNNGGPEVHIARLIDLRIGEVLEACIAHTHGQCEAGFFCAHGCVTSACVSSCFRCELCRVFHGFVQIRCTGDASDRVFFAAATCNEKKGEKGKKEQAADSHDLTLSLSSRYGLRKF
jgi:hypothetical protein